MATNGPVVANSTSWPARATASANGSSGYTWPYAGRAQNSSLITGSSRHQSW